MDRKSDFHAKSNLSFHILVTFLSYLTSSPSTPDCLGLSPRTLPPLDPLQVTIIPCFTCYLCVHRPSCCWPGRSGRGASRSLEASAARQIPALHPRQQHPQLRARLGAAPLLWAVPDRRTSLKEATRARNKVGDGSEE